jgi:hypothetical protein
MGNRLAQWRQMGIVGGNQTKLSAFTFVTTKCSLGTEMFHQTVQARNGNPFVFGKAVDDVHSV